MLGKVFHLNVVEVAQSAMQRDPADSVTIEPAVLHVGQDVDLLLDDIELNFGSKISLHIGSCSKSALVSLIKEMEGTLC